MLRYYCKIAWRHLVKDRQSSLLSLIGFSTGLACVILIWLWVSNEKSIDKFHANDSRLYQVMGNIALPDGIHTQEETPGLLADGLRKDMPEIEYAVSAMPLGTDMLSVGVGGSADKPFKATAQFVDKDFFHVFSYPLLQGDKDRLFADKNTVLISDEMAMRCFHTTDHVLGRTILWGDDKEPHIISGIFRHPPPNSSAQFDVLFSYPLFFEKDQDMHDWHNSNPMTYLVVKPGTDMNRFKIKMAGYLQTKYAHAPVNLFLRKYSDKYLYDTYENGVQTGGRIGYVRLFTLIAIFIIAIACINFMNLSTAKAAERGKELGVRKVSGAPRSGLIVQYMGESMLMTFCSLILALGWVLLLLPQFNTITGKTLSLDADPGFIGSVTALFVLTGLVAGSYPALYLSGVNPVICLKGRLPHSPGEVWIRKGLVVFQFTLSVGFIVSVLVIDQQIGLIQTMNLGYDKEHIVTFKNDGNLRKSFQPFLADLKSIPGVVNAATLDGDLTGRSSGSTEKIDWDGKKPGQQLLLKALDMDNQLMNVLGMKMATGRGFSRDFGSDSLSLILNQTAVDAMGIIDPVGKFFRVWGNTYTIIGVAKDFHYESLYEKVKPCFIRCISGGSTVFVKIAAGGEKSTLARIGKVYQEYRPGIPFDFSFMDQSYQAMYMSEQRISLLSRYFAGLAIIISCLGLFGLATFTAQKRQKEIGIRKVVGASVGNVMVMLSKDFLKLVTLAMLIAFPFAWWAMHSWLESFAYRASIGPGLFLLAGGSVLLLTVLTIGYQSVKAAVANPAKSLRSE